MRDHEVLTVKPDDVQDSVPKEYRERYIELHKEGYVFLRNLGVSESEAIARSTVWAELQTFIEIGREIVSLEAKEKAKAKPRPLKKKSTASKAGRHAVARRPVGGMSDSYRQRLVEAISLIDKAHKCYKLSLDDEPSIEEYQEAQALIAGYMRRGKSFPVEFQQTPLGSGDARFVMPEGLAPLYSTVSEGNSYWIVGIDERWDSVADEWVYTGAPGKMKFVVIKNGLVFLALYEDLGRAQDAIRFSKELHDLGTAYSEYGENKARSALLTKIEDAKMSEDVIRSRDISSISIGNITAQPHTWVNPILIEEQVANAVRPIRDALGEFGKTVQGTSQAIRFDRGDK